MKIHLNKEAVENLYRCTTENISLLSTAIHMHIENDELSQFFQEKLDAILFYLETAYNPELFELKHQARLYYQKWLVLKSTEPSTANTAYLEYLKLKTKIDDIEMPY